MKENLVSKQTPYSVEKCEITNRQNGRIKINIDMYYTMLYTDSTNKNKSRIQKTVDAT